MRDSAPQPTNGRNSIVGTLVTVLMTLGLVGVIWLIINRDALGALPPATEAVAPTDAQPWPTVLATFTPVATQPAVIIPTPTPIRPPAPRVLGELAVIEYTLTSSQTAGGVDKNTLKRLFGKDEVTMRVVGRVRVSIPVDQIARDLAIQPNGGAISVQLPALRVTGVELIPEQSSIVEARQRWVLSDYPGLELQAIGLAKNDLYHQVADSPDMMQLAAEVARLKIIDHLRNLGFTEINVTSASQ